MTLYRLLHNRDVLAGFGGLILVAAGAGSVQTEIDSIRPITSNWVIGVGCIIFGSMIFGVACSRFADAHRATRQKTKRTKPIKK